MPPPLATNRQLSSGLKRLANSKPLNSGATGRRVQNLLNNQKAQSVQPPEASPNPPLTQAEKPREEHKKRQRQTALSGLDPTNA